jgi:MraZ protein
MFLGKFEYTIDDKGRLTIPARYRNLLIDGAFILKGFDGNLIVMTTESFNKLASQVDETSITNPAARGLRRLIYSDASPVEIDKVGRFLLPSILREAAKIKTNVTIMGNGKYFEVWASEVLDEYQKSEENAQADAQLYTVFDLSVK